MQIAASRFLFNHINNIFLTEPFTEPKSGSMKPLFLGCVLLAGIINTHAKTVYSVSNGFWSDPHIWSDTAVPVPKDTIIINHYVIYNDTIFVDPTGLLLVDTCGYLCGGDIHVQGHFTNYGWMHIGSFWVTDSSFHLYGQLYCVRTSKVGGPTTGHPYLYGYGGDMKVGIPMPNCELERTITPACTTMALTDLTGSLAFNIYPNPATGYLNIEFSESGMITRGSIIDVTGRLLKAISIDSETTTISLKDLPPGSYTLILQTADGRFSSKRFIRLAE